MSEPAPLEPEAAAEAAAPDAVASDTPGPEPWPPEAREAAPRGTEALGIAAHGAGPGGGPAADPGGGPLAGEAAAPAVSVVIPHLNQPELLGACLDALAAQRFDMDRVEVIVVDNGSCEPPEKMVAARRGVRLAFEATPGPGPARNRGIALARAPILAFTDADCVPDPGWLAAIVEAFAARPEAAILGGDIRVFAANPDDPTVAEAFELLYGFRQRMQISRHKFSATANLAVRRAVFDAVGPFGGLDISEDLDWGQRAARAGYTTHFVETMAVAHPARRTMPALKAQWNRHVSHFYRQAAARPLGRVRWALTIPLMAASPLAEIPTILASRKISGWRDRGRVLQGVVSIRSYRAWRMLRALIDERGRTGNTEWNRKT